MTTMTNEQDIVFDANSGISQEEQQEILAQINGIAERNRLSLASGGAGEDSGKNKKSPFPGGARFAAKKSGAFFPLLINIAAAAILAGGFFILSSFQGKTDAQVREGTMVYNSAERALIEEIRKETSSRLEAKETEIAAISAKLASIDAELQGLYLDNGELDEAQIAAEGGLRATQEEYRVTLSQLQHERSFILEESRSREANLQAQLETRTRELALVAQQSAAAIDLARSEMDRLSGEQNQSAAVEAQMAAFFANFNAQVRGGRLDEAAATVQTMRSFMNTPAFQSLRSIQARRDMYIQSLNSFETMLEAARGNSFASGEGSADPALAALQERYALLEQSIAEKDRTIDALSSDDGGMAQRITELEGSLAASQTMRDGLERSSNEKTDRILFLESANTTLNQTVSRIQDVLQGKAPGSMTIDELYDSVARIQSALEN